MSRSPRLPNSLCSLVFDGLTATLRNELLGFFLEQDEHPQDRVLERLLKTFSASLAVENRLVLSFPAANSGWRALTSDGQSYAGPEPCPEDFARPPEWVEANSQEISFAYKNQVGRLTLLAPDQVDARMLPLLARVAYQLVRREHLEWSRQLHETVSQSLFGIVSGTLTIRNALRQSDSSLSDHVHEAVEYVLKLAEWGLQEIRSLKHG